jgi:hypothetical protein
VRPEPPGCGRDRRDAAGTAGMRPGPPGCGRDRRDAAGTAGMRPGPLGPPGPPGRGRASGRIWTHSHREPEQILLSQWGPGRRPTATSVPKYKKRGSRENN